MAKPKVASDWLCGCAGCHMSLLDIDERIVPVVELIDLRSSPITDLKMPDVTGVMWAFWKVGSTIPPMKKVALRMRKKLQNPGRPGRLCRLWRRSSYAQLLHPRRIPAPGLC